MRDGTPIPLHVARMLACDAARVDVTLGEDGELLDVGRRTRTIPSAIGRALWLRDGAGTPMHLGESLDWMLMAHTAPPS